MISQSYFFIQKLVFYGLGIDLMVDNEKFLVKRPVLTYGLIFTSIFHFILVTHYVWIHITDFLEVTDSMPLLCQLILCVWKMIIFLNKRQDILLLLNEVHEINFKAKHEELAIVKRENAKDYFVNSIYLRLVVVTGSCGAIHPIIYGLYSYITSGEIVLNEPNKSTYFWNHSHLAGYSLVYVLNCFSIYFACVVSLAIDSLFSWFVSNIVAQFHVICYRFEKLALKCSENIMPDNQQLEFIDPLVSCIQYHRQTLQLAEKLNRVYGEIIFIKFTIVCTEIFSLVFRASRPNESIAEVAYKGLFLCAVALQLVLYCYNGQRIKDESVKVNTTIYCAFDWSNLSKSFKRMLLLAMMRSQKPIDVRGVFFEMNLTLYLWVVRNAASLITALKTLEENQN